MDFNLTHLASELPNDKFAEEATHAEVLSVALCPYEARTVIAEVAIRAIKAMMDKDDISYPSSLIKGDWATQSDEDAAACLKEWHTIESKILYAFHLVLTESEWEFEPNAKDLYKELEDGLLLFAQYLTYLWV